MPHAFTVVAILSSLVVARAQDPAAREAKFVARAVAGLHAIADAYQAEKQHARALALRRELWLEYAADDEKARDKCGFTKVGDLWRLDAAKLVIEKDLTGNAKLLKRVDQDLVKLQKDLLDEHRVLAELFTQAGDTARAIGHWRRVLRFAPNDTKAASALALARFEGFHGNATELGMLRRGRAIRGAVDWLLRKQFDVQKIEGRQQSLLERAGITHHGFRTEHFELWGTLPEAQMTLVAQHVERALLLCYTLFGTAEGAPFEPEKQLELVFVADDTAYGKVLDLCADQFDASRLQFLKQEVDLSFLFIGKRMIRFYKTNGSDAEALDQAVRGVVQDAVGVRADGLWEGIGHAACGFLFGRTLTFMLEQQKAKTAASWTQRPLLPEMDVWREIAQQSAWAKSDTRTSQLVLISAARFTTEQRVKAWAMCDYLFHWRPELVRELELSQTKEIRTPPDVEAEFSRRTQLSLPQIDHEWREFWAKSDALRKAMIADPLGDPKAKEYGQRQEARTIVDAANDLRAAAMRGPVGFYLAEDADVQAALFYADRLTKAEQEQLRKPKLKVELPSPPVAIGHTVLWSRRSTAGEAIADWAKRPVWRDALLHPGRGLLGANKNKQALVLDLTEPVQPTRSGLPLCWPRVGQTAVPGSATVAELGPRAVAALAAAGKRPDDIVGMPFSLHFARAMTTQVLSTVGCRVYDRGQRREGVLVIYEASADGEALSADGDAADGCVAFVPFEPLGAGAAVDIEWELPSGLLGKDEKFPVVWFRVE